MWEERRQWAEALLAYGRALEWNERSGQQHQLGTTHHQIGRVWEERDGPAAAAPHYLAAVEALVQHPGADDPAIALRSLRRVLPAVADPGPAGQVRGRAGGSPGAGVIP